MKHYNEPLAPQKQGAVPKGFYINLVASLLLAYYYEYGLQIPYKAWRKNMKTIHYLSEKDYNLADSIAYGQYQKDAKDIIKGMKIGIKYGR